MVFKPVMYVAQHLKLKVIERFCCVILNLADERIFYNCHEG